eukprot:CAMPEP_0178428508 /NCGR_PEP_ID=MMETSP0689_2-20121128/30317_1 /TAXON_ID=160604 /ORGANISM="Amphidinium massartii, Strain CS-259" /LENGTH=71 /DNA_ID=CAMNT_0020050289 /DNA_START=895 /DNA_END=1110 /DNA_ORIENTATION=-
MTASAHIHHGRYSGAQVRQQQSHAAAVKLRRCREGLARANASEVAYIVGQAEALGNIAKQRRTPSASPLEL